MVEFVAIVLSFLFGFLFGAYLMHEEMNKHE